MALSNLLTKFNHLPTFQVEEHIPSETLTESPQCLLGIKGFFGFIFMPKKKIDSLQNQAY